MSKNTLVDAAPRLSRNPLGIVALFIVLVYSVAGLVLGASLEKLGTSERQPLIWFLVLFPCAVLVSFLWLVAKHRRALYGPGDFNSDESYLKTLLPDALIPETIRLAVDANVEKRTETAKKGTQPDGASDGAFVSYARSRIRSFRSAFAGEPVNRDWNHHADEVEEYSRMDPDVAMAVWRDRVVKRGRFENALEGIALNAKLSEADVQEILQTAVASKNMYWVVHHLKQHPRYSAKMIPEDSEAAGW